ncbi:MAG: hypothetical protein AB1Z22_12455 [Synechococcaceae cyanobacterium]
MLLPLGIEPEDAVDLAGCGEQVHRHKTDLTGLGLGDHGGEGKERDPDGWRGSALAR